MLFVHRCGSWWYQNHLGRWRSSIQHGNIYLKCFNEFLVLRTILAVSGSSPVKILTAGSSQFDVVTLVVVDTGLGQHSVVFDFGSTQLWGVVSQNDQLGLALTELTDGFSVTQVVFTLKKMVSIRVRVGFGYLPDLMTSWRRELMDEPSFFAFLETIFDF